jgi:hypothetical protein
MARKLEPVLYQIIFYFQMIHTVLPLLILVNHVAAADVSCTWNSVQGASFDLTGLKNTFVVEGGDIDCTQVIEQNYTYAFNPCGPAVVGKDLCDDVDAGTAEDAAVLQYSPKSNGKSCYPAGRIGLQEFGMADTTDRSKGIKVTFGTNKESDKCHTNNVFRKTDIKILCDENALKPDVARFSVTEPQGPKGCQYEIIMYSVHGCPTQCSRGSDGKVCSGHGLCMTDAGIAGDNTDETARCFCNNGWKGDACNESGESDHNSEGSSLGGAIALLVILFLLMIGLGVVLVMLVKQIKGYHDDTANYLAIREDGGEDGSF